MDNSESASNVSSWESSPLRSRHHSLQPHRCYKSYWCLCPTYACIWRAVSVAAVLSLFVQSKLSQTCDCQFMFFVDGSGRVMVIMSGMQHYWHSLLQQLCINIKHNAMITHDQRKRWALRHELKWRKVCDSLMDYVSFTSLQLASIWLMMC